MRDLVEKYKESLRKEWNLLQEMREIRRKLMDVEDRVFGAIAESRQVREEDVQEYGNLIEDLYGLVFEHVELLEDQSALRGKIAVEEYEGRADKGALEEYHRVLGMWPWEVTKSEN